jgi:hypothetical protein
VRRDGEVRSTHDTHDEAFAALLRAQPHSVSWATTHEGWDIVEVDDQDEA